MDITKIISGLRISPLHTAPMYLQLANGLAAKIQNFTLAKGTKLPPERELAKLLEISRTTTINVYRLLEKRRLVVTKVIKQQQFLGNTYLLRNISLRFLLYYVP